MPARDLCSLRALSLVALLALQPSTGLTEQFDLPHWGILLAGEETCREFRIPPVFEEIAIAKNEAMDREDLDRMADYYRAREIRERREMMEKFEASGVEMDQEDICSSAKVAVEQKAAEIESLLDAVTIPRAAAIRMLAGLE